MNLLNDYMDGDLAYFIGLIVARGTITHHQGIRQINIEFPFSSLKVKGISIELNQEQFIRLGLIDIQERLSELLETDIRQIKKDNSVDLVIRFMRNNLIWRDLMLILDSATNFAYFQVPDLFFSSECPDEWKREFIKGYGDVAGNIRSSNHYTDGRHRVRLDVLNYPTNWELSVQLCNLLQNHLDIPIQLITWGHPNLGRTWKEHQINIFANQFLPIGFTFEHKQEVLKELATYNQDNFPNANYSYCPGQRKIKKSKPQNQEQEKNEDKLDNRLVGNHYDAYWQICQALGCQRWNSENEKQLNSNLDTNLDED